LKYIEKLVKTYEQMFGEPPNQVVSSPLEKGDHPELDTSELGEFKVPMNKTTPTYLNFATTGPVPSMGILLGYSPLMRQSH
jgi:hypothetical protein